MALAIGSPRSVRAPHALLLLLGSALLVTACSGGQSAAAPAETPAVLPPGTKSVTIGITDTVNAMSIAGSGTTDGGWQSLNELHSEGLITAAEQSRTPVARLATQVPSLDNGLIVLNSDGTMTSTYPLRHDVTWQDGVPFTAQDMTFGYQLDSDPSLPFINRDAIAYMGSVSAPDDFTFVIHWKTPYYEADSIGLRALWPQPAHILLGQYQTLDPQAFINLPYWTTQYVHMGAFKLTNFQPGVSITFAAYDRYFLGRPKLDQVIVKIFNDQDTLFSSVQAGAVDMLMDNSLGPQLGLQLKDQWDASGAGKVYLGTGTTRFIAPQFDPSIQRQPAVLNPQVRQALMYALDRGAISATVQDGHSELIANSLVPPGDPLYDAVADDWATYTYDPARATAILSQLGWTPGSDGILVNSNGDRLATQVWTTEGEDQEIALIASYWKQVGVDAAQHIISGAEARDRQQRSSYPGFETSARGSGDSILARVETDQDATAANSYSGANRGDYSNPQLDQLINQYRETVSDQDQGTALKTIDDLMVSDLPVMLLYYNPTTPAARTGVTAFDDFAGGAEASRLYGTFSRDAYQWALQ